MPRNMLTTLIVGLGVSIATASSIPSRVPYTSLDAQQPISNDRPHHKPERRVSKALQDVLDALATMQETYFDTFAGTWGSAIDWTAAVTGTHVSSTLTAIVDGLDLQFEEACTDILRWENIINEYYTQTAFFYFGENAFGLRNQAFDDMLWVVLGWLESTKFSDMYSRRHATGDEFGSGRGWHGLQLAPMASHRSRIFYELAGHGWDESLCGGGMTWNPSLTPYKNAITNELWVAGSIGMYLYFQGDNSSAPFAATGGDGGWGEAHDPVYLENAVKSYKWLKEAGMRNWEGLYQDGFHVSGWKRWPNGTVNRGTGECDELNTMVYTYNQGVLLSASRGLWLATGARSYLDDGHDLVSSVIRATGWPNDDKQWRGLGRGGVLEEYCDHGLYCSQDGQTFKGIFFTHLTEFCRPLRSTERELSSRLVGTAGFDENIYRYHLARCAAYAKWIGHNAEAALKTKNEEGLFGGWWGVEFGSQDQEGWEGLVGEQILPGGAVDYLNPAEMFTEKMGGSGGDGDRDLNDRGRGRTVETQGSALAVLRARWVWGATYR